MNCAFAHDLDKSHPIPGGFIEGLKSLLYVSFNNKVVFPPTNRDKSEKPTCG
jgi:hypothetical protein